MTGDWRKWYNDRIHDL